MLPSLSVDYTTQDAFSGLEDLYLELHRRQVTASPTRLGLAAASDQVAWERRRAFYIDSGSFIVRAHANDRLIGYAAAETRQGFAGWGPEAPLGVVHDLVVAEAARRRGVGTLLLQRVRLELRTSGAVALQVNVVSRNADAVAFYSHHGFEAIAETLGVALV